MMHSKFSQEKATEAAAKFLTFRKDQTMNYLGLIKLLYTADRIAFERLNESITGDTYVAMKYGPVLSNVYDLIKGNADSENFWYSYIHKDSSYKVRLKADPGVQHLSRAELKIIYQVYEDVGHLDRFELAEKTHQDFPEWEDPLPLKSKPIYIEEILKNLGKSEEEIEEIRDIIQMNQRLDELLNVEFY